MKKILIYGGTTEGRVLAETLTEKGYFCEVCVATEYGQQVMTDSDNIQIQQGRLSVEQMKKKLQTDRYLAVVDATHPFATEVTKNIKESVRQSKTPFFRLFREENEEKGEDFGLFYDDLEACISFLKQTKGKILLTTGSKDLHRFCQEDGLRKRLIVRVLPGMESLSLCYESGLEGKQIIAMQGPFSLEMNIATIRQYGISHLVTKESGKVGGVDQKIEAARRENILCHRIRRPEEKHSRGFSMRQVVEQIEALEKEKLADDKSGQEIIKKSQKADKMRIYLAGIGMNGKDSLTLEAKRAIEQSDYLFGAKRMIQAFNPKKGKYPYYLKEQILPCILEMQKKEEALCVTILFSGDTGFYSGCQKMYEALQKLQDVEVFILPGISTIAALSAKTGICWQDAYILSMHGIEETLWMSKLSYALRHSQKIFFLTSGLQDIKKLGKILLRQEQQEANLYLGYQLSYPEEEILKIKAKECEHITKKGLYAGILVPNRQKKFRITPGILDAEFLRDKVPMTKEEVREISICKLGLTKDATVYDIGSGTGSIAIEMAMLSPDIKVYAIETKEVAVELIKKNKEQFFLPNIEVISALAPQGLQALPKPSHVFIGGTKGNLLEILQCLYEKQGDLRIVINAITIETLVQIQEIRKHFPIEDEEIIQVGVARSKKLGAYHLMQAENPIFIVSFSLKAKKQEEDA